MFKPTVNPCWYTDGVEDGEQCWRYDTKNDHYQVQLFAGCPNDDGWCSVEGCRLFVQRDIRLGVRRIDDAYRNWDIDAATLIHLLSMEAEALEVRLEGYFGVVAVQPC